MRNSWGEYWGEGGWFRLKRGENQLLLESNCAWAVPGSWTELGPTPGPRPPFHSNGRGASMNLGAEVLRRGGYGNGVQMGRGFGIEV